MKNTGTLTKTSKRKITKMTIVVVGDSTGDNSDKNAGKGSTEGVNHDDGDVNNNDLFICAPNGSGSFVKKEDDDKDRADDIDVKRKENKSIDGHSD